MKTIAAPDERDRLLPARARIVPIASTLAASALATLPIVADAPVAPPFGLLMLLAWRLLRPELWQAWVALPLGAFDDLMSGQPFGSAITLWTASLVALDMMDNRAIWRDYWLDWLVATVAIAFCLVGGWAVVAITSKGALGGGTVVAVVPQILMTILCFPLTMRLCAVLDRWRLVR